MRDEEPQVALRLLERPATPPLALGQRNPDDLLLRDLGQRAQALRGAPADAGLKLPVAEGRNE